MAAPKVIISAALDPEAYQRVAVSANEQDITISQWLRRAIELKLQVEQFQKRQQAEAATKQTEEAIEKIIKVINGII